MSPETDHNDSRLTRFALFTDLCLSTFPSDIFLSFKFFNRFIMFTDNYGVREMMKNLLDCSLRKGQLYRGLIAKHFVAKVARQITECKAASVADGRLTSLWEILVFCIRNKHLKESVCVPSIAELATDFPIISPELEDVQWELISEFEFGDQNLILGVAREAILLLGGRSRFGRAEVAAIRFMSGILKGSAGIERLIDQCDLANSLKWLCENFPDHSVGILAIADLVAAGVQKRETSDAFLDVFRGFIVNRIEDEMGSRTLRVCMIECLHLISLADNDVLADYPELSLLVRSVVVPYKRAVTERYGEAPSHSCRRVFPSLHRVVGAHDWVTEISC
jgi:hypothetical protein